MIEENGEPISYSDALEDIEERFQIAFDEYKKERNERLHKFFVRVMIIFALLGVTMSVTVYYVYHTGQDNKDGLCAMRAEAEDRIVQSAEFLKDHPDGIPGITPAVIKRGIVNAARTRDALKNLSCDDRGDT